MIENAGTSISPSILTEKYLDLQEEGSTKYKKEIVKIGENDYVKWHYEILNNDSERERKFFGLSKSGVTVADGEENGRQMMLKIDIMSAIFPAVNIDVGDSSIKIVEVFKKI